MAIDTQDMTSALYVTDFASLDEPERVMLWTHINAIVADLTESATGARHADAMRLVPTLRFQDMSDDVRTLFRIALERMPGAQARLLNSQLDVVMGTPAPERTIVVRDDPHGLALRYHEMNVRV